MSDIKTLNDTQSNSTTINIQGDLRQSAMIAGGVAVAAIAALALFVLVKQKITPKQIEPERKLEEGFTDAKVYRIKKFKKGAKKGDQVVDAKHQEERTPSDKQ